MFVLCRVHCKSWGSPDGRSRHIAWSCVRTGTLSPDLCRSVFLVFTLPHAYTQITPGLTWRCLCRIPRPSSELCLPLRTFSNLSTPFCLDVGFFLPVMKLPGSTWLPQPCVLHCLVYIVLSSVDTCFHIFCPSLCGWKEEGTSDFCWSVLIKFKNLAYHLSCF